MKSLKGQAATGTGKTLGIAMYFSMLADMPTELDIESILNGSPAKPTHPGGLIVTRLISEANALAEKINELAGCTTARAYHSENRLSEEEVFASPVPGCFLLGLDYLLG